MKKILLYAITMVFAVAISTAYAYEEGKVMNNGITDFAGKTIDTLSDLSPAVPGAMEVEGANAGGIREEGAGVEWFNGVTIFNGKGISTRTDLDDYFAAAYPADMKAPVVESSNAGGIRMEEPALPLVNGITDFSGETHDSL